MIAPNKQVELSPAKKFWNQYNLANSLLEQEKWLDAVDAYQNAIGLNPEFA
ncbi:tetratricopeptide repeat protein [Microcoleus sp. T3_A4]|uniref:tetratricopeptide repeat protein n=1 Tax=Microcoleus sp. T3_A4 TaxID=2818968 RepID=UPI002FD43089